MRPFDSRLSVEPVVDLLRAKTPNVDDLQERMFVQNPGWMRHGGEVAPDGDVHLAEREHRRSRAIGKRTPRERLRGRSRRAPGGT